MKTNFVLGGFGVVLVSLSALAGCSGSSVSIMGGDGGSTTRTAESSCDVVISWLQSCNMTLDKAKCVKGASAYSQKQLEGAEQCTHRSDCDKQAFGKCMDQVEASEPAATSTTATSASKDAGTRPTNDPTGGSADAGSGSGSGNGGTSGGSSAACQSCIVSKCATQIQACQANASCTALASCISAANGDSAEQQTCMSQNSAGTAPYNAIITCGESACASACTQ